MASIQTPSAVPSITVGGRVFTDTSNLIVLYGFGGGSSPNFSARKQGSSAGYQVPVGKVFKAQAVVVMPDSGTRNTLLLGYSDNDVGVGTATAFTNGVGIAGGALTSNSGSLISGFSGGLPIGVATDFQVPATKFLSGQVGTTGLNATVIIYGYEV